MAWIAKVDQHMASNRQIRPRHIEQAVVAAGPVAQGVGQEIRHLTEGQGQHDEVDAGAANGQGTYQ
ncbi:hypothetical protein D3C77_609530 [compost metagenome]